VDELGVVLPPLGSLHADVERGVERKRPVLVGETLPPLLGFLRRLITGSR
jgi:hypothetical protein